MKAVEVGGDVLELPTDIFDAGDNRGTIIDSGTTLAYLPDEVLRPMMKKVYNKFRVPFRCLQDICMLLFYSTY